MATTRHETILAAIATLFTPVSTGATTVERSRTAPFQRNETPGINLQPKTSPFRAVAQIYAAHDFDVEISIETRGDLPDQIADPIVAAVHSLLMADPTLGGKCGAIIGPHVDWEFTDADGPACKTTLTYTVGFGTPMSDLTRLA